MFFNSLHLAVFFTVVVCLYFILSFKLRPLFLLVASYWFYMSWNPTYAPLILTSTLVDYAAGIGMGAVAPGPRRTRLLMLSLAVNLGLLFTFKYANFAFDSARSVADWLGWNVDLPTLDLLLQEYTPRMLLIHIDPQMIVDLERFGRVSMLSPLMHRSQVVRDLIYEQGPWERIKYLIDSYRYNDRLIEIASHLGDEERSLRGYLPRRGSPSPERLNEVMWPRSFALVQARLGDAPDPRRVALLREMIRAAREREVAVVLVTSPHWRPPGVAEDPRRRRLMDSLVSIAAEEKVPFIRVAVDDPIEIWDATRFADSQHMNERGAEAFSTLVVERLRRLLAPGGPEA